MPITIIGEAFRAAWEKKELIDLMEKNNPTPDGKGPHILTEMHIVLTADGLHDPAAVMHFNSEILIPYLKDNVDGFASGKGVMHLHTDGAPNQFHCKDIYYWTDVQSTLQGPVQRLLRLVHRLCRPRQGHQRR